MSKNIAAVVIFSILFSNAVLLAGKVETSRKGDSKVAEQFKSDLGRHFKSKDYSQASVAALKLIELDPKNKQWYYNLAQAQTRLGRKDDAFASLDKAVELGLAQESYRMSMDVHLNSLRDDPRYTELHRKIRSKLPYEKGAKIKGVKTIEANPEHGLRYRLRMSPKASEKKPQRLVVWMHPSGGASMNAAAEQLASSFVERGFALLVCTQKQFMAWTGEEIAALMNATLKHVGKTKGIDSSRPVLMGFSAGAQVALMQYAANPAKLGGLILHGAFPVVPQGSGGGKWKPMERPADDAIKKVPVLTIYGSLEKGADLWDAEGPKWKKAGVPLTIHVVDGGRHRFYFAGKPGLTVGKWLEAVGRGKLPGKKTPALGLAELNAQIAQSIRQKNYPEAEKTIRRVIELTGEDGHVLYNLACLQSLQNKPDEAIQSLAQALDKGYSDIRRLQRDPDLAALQGRKDFKELIARGPEIQRQRAEETLTEMKKRFREEYLYEIDHDLKIVFIVPVNRQKLDMIKADLSARAKAMRAHLFSYDFERYVTVIMATKADRSKVPEKDLYIPRRAILFARGSGRPMHHEFTHALHFADSLSRGQVHPTWILEGLASSFELSKVKKGRLLPTRTHRLGVIRKAMEKKQVPSLKEFVTRAGKRDYRQSKTFWEKGKIKNYAIACHIIRYLQDAGKLKDWYDAYCAGYEDDASGLKALEKTLGKTINEIDTDWQKWLLAQ